jgi:predicted pyridoxine 5'-phosphate oxidase superfamily flavin-nucleotide-binding protein
MERYDPCGRASSGSVPEDFVQATDERSVVHPDQAMGKNRYSNRSVVTRMITGGARKHFREEGTRA